MNNVLTRQKRIYACFKTCFHDETTARHYATKARLDGKKRSGGKKTPYFCVQCRAYHLKIV